MNHTNGTQLPHGMLPSVEVLTPGLVLLFKHPHVDRRYALEHIEDLSDSLRGSPLRPSFSEQDYGRGSLDEVLRDLIRRRSEAVRDGRVYFVLTPHFVPRVVALTELADSAFHYVSGLNSALLIAAKVDGELINGPVSEKHIAVLNRKSKYVPEETKHPEEEGITISVKGLVCSGRSAVSAVIYNALKDKWPHLHVDWHDPDNAQAITQSNLIEGRYESIGAKSFKIINEAAVKPIKPAESSK